MASKVGSTETSCLKKLAGGDGMLGDAGNPPEKSERHSNSKPHTLKAVSVYRLPARDKTGRGIGPSLPLMMRRGIMTPRWKTPACLSMKQTRCRSTAWTTPAPLLPLHIRDTDQIATSTMSPMRKTGPRSVPLHYGKPHIRSVAA